jgi:SAM-dependent methyltransferase
MSDPITYGCGCVNAVDEPSGILRSVSKCDRHLRGQRDPATLDAAYYAELGVIDAEGNLRPTAHVAELVEALGPFPPAPPGGKALEIGCGVSPYARPLIEAGWRYWGLDLSRWAVQQNAFITKGAKGIVGPWEHFDPDEQYGLILAAHCLEHMADPPAAVAKMARLLEPGGEMWIVVPHGEDDPVNPDHLAFLSPETLGRTLEAAGLAVERLEVRRIVPHERFIYARARKPA